MEEITTYTLVSFNNRTALDPTFVIPERSFLGMVPRLEAISPLNILSYIFTVSVFWKLLFILLVLGNLKNLPFMWHVSTTIVLFSNTPRLTNFQMRLVNGFRFVLRSQRSKVTLTSAQIFQPLITSSHAPLSEIDFNIHSKHIQFTCELVVFSNS